jgi:DNA-binding MarR family transcriptional regulator
VKLEDEINQTKFRSEYQKLNLNLIFTNNWVQNKHRKTYEEFGVTPQQYNVLRILKGNYPKPYSTSQIRMRMLDPMSDASRIVERLIQKKLVERKTCKSDRRLVDVVITQKGLNLIEYTSSAIAAQEKIFHALTITEAQDLNTLLDKLRAE